MTWQLLSEKKPVEPGEYSETVLMVDMTEDDPIVYEDYYIEGVTRNATHWTYKPHIPGCTHAAAQKVVGDLWICHQGCEQFYLAQFRSPAITAVEAAKYIAVQPSEEA